MDNNNYNYNSGGGQLPPDQTQHLPESSIGGYNPNQPIGYAEQSKEAYGTQVKPYPGGIAPQPLPPSPGGPIQPYQLPQAPLPYTQVDIDRVRAEAAKTVKDRQAFRQHLTSYIFVISLLVVIWLVTSIASGGFIYFWPIWAAFGWGIGLFSHYMSVYGGWARQSEVDRQREIDAEVRRRMGR